MGLRGVNMKSTLKQKSHLVLILLGLVSGMFFLSHCGKDKTVADYHQKKVDEAMVQLQSVSGIYRGSLVNAKDNSDMGDLEVELSPKADPVTSEDNSTTAAQVYLQGKVSLFQKSQSNAIISKAHYFGEDSVSTTNFSGVITVTLANGTTATMSMTGRIDGDQLNGEMFANGRNGIVGKFKLRKNAPFTRTHQQDTSAPNTISIYKGMFTQPYCNLGRDNLGNNKCDTLVTLNIQNITSNLGENFLNNFFLERNVAITITFARVTDLQPVDGVSLQNATLDLQNGTIIAHGSYSGNVNAIIDLNCNSTLSDSGAKGWACTYKSEYNGKTHVFSVFPIPEFDIDWIPSSTSNN